jgi:hypothetical protein
MRKPTLLIIFATLILSSTAAFAQQFKVGDRVDADVMHIGIWKSGVITEVLPFDRYKIQLDEDLGRHEATLCLGQYIKAGGGGGSTTNAPKTTYSGSTATTGPFKIGQRVMADATQIGNFKPGTITEILPLGRFRVQFDDEIGRYEPTVILEKHMKAAGNLPPPAPSSNAARQAYSPAQQQLTHTPESGPATPHSNSAAKPTTPLANAGEGLPAGKGTPPSGKYVAQKISPGGQLIGLGDLEIRGNTYRGIAGGNFAPFSVSGGNITWSAGITGMPNGWVIRKSVYLGLDDMKRPYIRVYYRSTSGFNDAFDCIRE